MMNNNLGPPTHHRMRIRCAVQALGIAPNERHSTRDQTFAIKSCPEIRRRLVRLPFAGRKPSNREKLEGGNRKIFSGRRSRPHRKQYEDAKTTTHGVVATLSAKPPFASHHHKLAAQHACEGRAPRHQKY